MQRLGLAFLALLSLSACSSTGVSDRYAFWRDDGSQNTMGTKPNLADVPTPPNVQDTQAEMDAMRLRLQAERDNAYLAAQGVPVSDVTPIADAPLDAGHTVASDELAPASASPTAPYYAAPVAAYPSQPQSSGNVQYNYATNDQAYVYGNSPLQYRGQQVGASRTSPYQQQAYGVMAANPNVSINFDALGGNTSKPFSGISSVGLTGQPVVFFEHGSARLGSGDRQKIKQLAQQLKAQPQSVVVIGHASTRTGLKNPVSSRAANLQMSAKRATAVMQELAKHGVKPERLNVTATGDTGAGSKATETQDRRVDILFD